MDTAPGEAFSWYYTITCLTNIIKKELSKSSSPDFFFLKAREFWPLDGIILLTRETGTSKRSVTTPSTH
jgi:hypothetical protein